MKVLELLKVDREYCKAINNDKSIIEQYDEAISEIHTLLMYKYLANNYLEVVKCKCGVLKVKGYLCFNENCTEE